jgi:hypothetical protein
VNDDGQTAPALDLATFYRVHTWRFVESRLLKAAKLFNATLFETHVQENIQKIALSIAEHLSNPFDLSARPTI